eukprot:jgi/Chrzof1/4840/Cz15g01060.t1_MME1[v5.2]
MSGTLAANEGARRVQHLLQHALPALSALQEQILSKGVCHRCYASLTPPPPADAIQEDDLPDFSPQASPPVSVVHKLGPSVINDPWYNKGTAFPMSERERLGLRGLLPPRIITMQLQEQRFMMDYLYGVDMIPPEEVKSGGVTSEMARRWMLLQSLQDRNETLFYRILTEHFTEMAPIVYTPTVGWVCVNYHKLYRRPRGMYFSAHDKGEMAAVAYNWPQPDVHAIVVTDGSRILGLGDLGLNGLGIPIGKLDLYCAAAGFSPARVLPCVIDVGTNNEALRNDPLYVGLKQPRVSGKEYYAIVDEFVHAVMSRWPKAVLQFEDFSIDHALVLLERYRHHHTVFNDDIQGTAATALAGLYGALRRLGKSPADLAKQRVVCLGAGSAGMGVARMIAAGMEKQGQLSPEEAAKNFWVLDAGGLITTARGSLKPHVQKFARDAGEEGDHEGEKLLEVVKRVKPSVLLGLAGAGKLFTAEVLQAMGEGCDQPLIFPMSNPISKMECTSEEAIRATHGRCVYASGSPQPAVEYEGTSYEVAQANNMYIFPGVALGAHLGQAGVITDAMLMAAAETLPTLIPEEDLAKGIIYPRLADIRSISVTIAAAVIKTAVAEGLKICPEAAEPLRKGDESLKKWIADRMFYPTYSSMAYLPPGIGE